MECIQLRVKDIDFKMNQIVVRDGKSIKDRITLLPETVKLLLKEHLERIRMIHWTDLSKGYGSQKRRKT